ncbi:heavy-metal-associated domain-containing protein [Flavobacterium sp.]|jgi:copper chaperone|uniref:heavy-metal-associated domain-containing protein n=1 Tax=Flavobacterium sp. TaxID=239 RepID=UPI0038FD3C68
MKTEKIIIANLKCSGCETTIKKGLLKLDGVTSVKINQETDTVHVTYDDNVEREKITNKLHSMGYPEATEENGLLLKIKSYASCMIGKIDNL